MPRIMEFLKLNACILTEIFFSCLSAAQKVLCSKSALSKLFPTEFANLRAHIKSS